MLFCLSKGAVTNTALFVWENEMGLFYPRGETVPARGHLATETPVRRSLALQG